MNSQEHSILYAQQHSHADCNFQTLKNVTDMSRRKYSGEQVNTVAADALVPCIGKQLAAVVLTLPDTLVPVFHKEGFKLLAHHAV